ncbi:MULTISPECIES: Txe/YoeB family addiction module toxin [unclassified Enterococcus]|uniref:Txe/YoeB family addiction module toxin n=1 Tax=unclassified Enterococcus TaxID=2608891 RepID=UPI000A3382B3|nr:MULTISPECIES: Txe/YoeB family addiction module toxin [unclassified Enterococcus]OTO67763.1 txe/YoeB family addiction module toxin [Enterococcus sp. 12E11_DIV0728]OUZ15701.1 txe/YoeB family addiction module toxin [Enterococcus sp. 12F9_DIV0723]
MSNYSVRIKNSAKADLKKIKQSNLVSQFEKVIQTLKEDPYLPTQSFEKLKPTREGRYSRRLNRQHRVVYRVNEEEKQVDIYSAWTHYES